MVAVWLQPTGQAPKWACVAERRLIRPLTTGLKNSPTTHHSTFPGPNTTTSSAWKACPTRLGIGAINICNCPDSRRQRRLSKT
jgi:hypothetical protein